MNTQIRRVAVIAVLMVLALLASTTSLQYFQAPTLRADGRNMRTFYASFDRDRGPIVVAGQAVATSVEADDEYGYQRVYPEGPLYAHVTGYFSVLPSSTGLERAADDVLTGQADSLFLSRIQDLFTGKQPQGGTVELTLNPKAQQAAFDGLGEAKGAVVALDPATGEILTMVSKPSYDPNDLAVHSAAAVLDAYDKLDPETGTSPLLNRAIAGSLYFPGSTFKLITAAAALESGSYTSETVLPAPTTLTLPHSSVPLPNFGDSQCSATGEMTLAQALAISCNTAFAKLGMDLGATVLRAQAERFGFGTQLTIPLAVTPSTYPDNPDEAQTAQSAIGQFDDRVTPLQMALVVAAIANGGTIMTPHLVRTERNADLQVTSSTAVQELSQPISPTTASQLKDMMIGVVEAGSGGRAAIDGLSVGGKTGTAQKAEGQSPDVWFVGFAESGQRQVVVAVVVEDGGELGPEGTGSVVAAPIAKAVMEAVLLP